MRKMKRMLTRIIALALVAVFFTAPSTVLAASYSTPVLIHDFEGAKIYMYQPNPLEIYKTSTNLPDLAGGHASGFWSVPAGKDFLFHVDTTGGEYEIFVLLEGIGIVSRKITSGDGHVWLPALSKDSYYGVWVRAENNDLTVPSGTSN